MIYSLQCILPVCLLVISASKASASTDSSAAIILQVRDFTLKDQHKAEHKQTFPRENISIIALADRKGSDQLEDWITPFYKRYAENVDICGVANLKGVPKLLRPMIRGLFRKGVEYPVMMDWTGAVCESLNYTAGVADIFVVDTAGAVVHRISGAATDERLKACYAVIDRLIQEKEEGAAEKADVPPQEQAPQVLESTSGAPAQEA